MINSGILIADCGSTGCDWRYLKDDKIHNLPSTSGFNPNYQSLDELTGILKSKPDFLNLQSEVQRLVFYGAGCAASHGKNVVKEGLSHFYRHAKVAVHSDLIGAAHAFYSGEPLICGILGTGSNAGHFDGDKITQRIPSLGYVLGDDGSGGKIGQLLLRAYYYCEMPPLLRADFTREYNLDLEKQLEAIYRLPRPAAHFAQFAPFAAKHIGHPFVRNLVAQTLRDFLTYFVCRFEDYRKRPVGIVGSVAHFFRDILTDETARIEISNLEIIQRPIERLAEYHRKQA